MLSMWGWEGRRVWGGGVEERRNEIVKYSFNLYDVWKTRIQESDGLIIISFS